MSVPSARSPAVLQARFPVAIPKTCLHGKARTSRFLKFEDVFDFCLSLGADRIIFDIAYPPAPPESNPLLDPYFDDTVEYHRAAVDSWFRTLLNGQRVPKIYFRDLLLPLLGGVSAAPPACSCGAAEADFAIGPSGDLYGCQLLYGNSDYRMGNVVLDVYPGISTPLPVGPGPLPWLRWLFSPALVSAMRRAQP